MAFQRHPAYFGDAPSARLPRTLLAMGAGTGDDDSRLLGDDPGEGCGATVEPPGHLLQRWRRNIRRTYLGRQRGPDPHPVEAGTAGPSVGYRRSPRRYRAEGWRLFHQEPEGGRAQPMAELQERGEGRRTVAQAPPGQQRVSQAGHAGEVVVAPHGRGTGDEGGHEILAPERVRACRRVGEHGPDRLVHPGLPRACRVVEGVCRSRRLRGAQPPGARGAVARLGGRRAEFVRRAAPRVRAACRQGAAMSRTGRDRGEVPQERLVDDLPGRRPLLVTRRAPCRALLQQPSRGHHAGPGEQREGPEIVAHRQRRQRPGPRLGDLADPAHRPGGHAEEHVGRRAGPPHAIGVEEGGHHFHRQRVERHAMGTGETGEVARQALDRAGPDADRREVVQVAARWQRDRRGIPRPVLVGDGSGRDLTPHARPCRPGHAPVSARTVSRPSS